MSLELPPVAMHYSLEPVPHNPGPYMVKFNEISCVRCRRAVTSSEDLRAFQQYARSLGWTRTDEGWACAEHANPVEDRSIAEFARYTSETPERQTGLSESSSAA